VLGRFRRADEGVSTVVSAVLVFTLVTVVFSIYMSTIVPDQVADEEAQHMRNVSSSLGEIASRISASTSLGREGEFSTLVDLGTTTLPGISLFHSAGSIEIEDRGFYSNFLCDAPKVLARNGQAAPGGTYAPFGAGATFPFQTLMVLDLRISGYSFGPGTDDGTVTVTVDGSTIATLRIALAASDHSLKVTTRDAASTIVYEQILESGLGSTVPSYTINALTPGYGLSSLLSESQGPFDLTTSSTSGSLSLYALYWKEDGTLGQAGSGRVLPAAFQRSVNPASLVYRAANNRFMDQEYSLEGGALVLGQDEGEHLTLSPFSIRSTPTSRLLHLSMINLTGSGYATGSHRATLTTTIREPVASTLECTDPTILLSSEYPIAWHAAWSDALVSAGLSETQAQRSNELVAVRLTGTWTVLLDEARVAVRIS
jgi:hypothetical protein